MTPKSLLFYSFATPLGGGVWGAPRRLWGEKRVILSNFWNPLHRFSFSSFHLKKEF